MRLGKTIVPTSIMIIIHCNGCLDPYAPPIVNGAGNYLVVSGFLNAGDSSCSITLSRSQLLSAVDVSTTESDATVFIEDENGILTKLPLQGYGVYINQKIDLNSQLNYRLHIITGNGEAYYSDYVPILHTPPIDTLSWVLNLQAPGGEPTIDISLTSSGTTNQSRYYFWNYTETWQHHSAFVSDLKYVNGQVVTAVDSNYFCWESSNSTDILISSTGQLSRNVVNQFPIISIPVNSIKLYDEYSIGVTQMSLTEDAFEYWQQLKATTEDLGTIFGPLPSRFSGNIHSASNAAEPVFGNFSATVSSQKRIFIRPWDFYYPVVVRTGYEDCILVKLPISDLNKLGLRHDRIVVWIGA